MIAPDGWTWGNSMHRHEWRYQGRFRRCWCGVYLLGVLPPVPAKAAHRRKYGH